MMNWEMVSFCLSSKKSENLKVSTENEDFEIRSIPINKSRRNYLDGEYYLEDNKKQCCAEQVRCLAVKQRNQISTSFFAKSDLLTATFLWQ